MGQDGRERHRRIGSFLSLERNVLVASVTALMTNFGAQAFLPFIPLYLEALKADITQIGIVYVAIAIATNLGPIPGGVLADKIGRKRVIVVGTTLGFGLYFALFGARDWIMAMLILFAANIFATSVQPAFSSTVAESVHEADRTTAFSTFYVLVFLGLTLGSVVGGFLPNPGRFQLNILIIASAGVAAALARFMFLRETLAPEARAAGDRSRGRFFIAHLSRNVWSVLIAILLFNFSAGLGQAIYAIFSMQQLQLSQAEFAIMVGLSSLASMLGAFGSGRISKMLGVRRLMIMSAILSSLLLIPWIYAPSAYFAIGVFAVSGFFTQFFFIGNQTLMANITRPEERSSAIGFIMSVAGIGAIVAPYIGSELWVFVNPRVPFLVAVVLTGLVAVPLIIVREPSMK